MKRGSIFWVNLVPATPPEFGKLRPALVISNSEQNSILSTVIVLPFSTKAPAIWPLRLECTLPNRKKSYAVLPGIRQISKQRLGQLIGHLTATELGQIDEAVATYLSD